MLGIRWQDKIPDTEVLSRANMYSIDTMLRSGQLRWAGHVRRMDDTRIPKQLLYGELENGSRSRGGQKKGYKLQTVA
jgi:transcription termination factor 2